MATTSETNATQPAGRITLLHGLLLIAVTCVVYGRAASFAFINLDDRVNVADNPRFDPVTVSGLLEFWQVPYQALYVPVTYTWFGLLATIAEQPPTADDPEHLQAEIFHLGNLLLHCGGALLAYVLLAQLFAHRGAALLGALIYSVHPLHVESVAWITEAKGLLSALFSLAALSASLRFAMSTRRAAWWGLAASGLFLAALLSKPSAVTLPMIVLLVLSVQPNARHRRAVVLMAGWLVIAAILTIATKSQQADGHIEHVPPLPARALVAIDATTFYLQKLVVPWPLCPDYGRTPAAALGDHLLWLRVLAPLAVLGIALAVPARRLAVVAIGVFFLALLPTSGLVPFGFQNYSTVADRYACFALLAPALLAAGLLARSWNKTSIVAASVWIVVLASISFVQTGYWQNTQTLFARTLVVNPRSHLSCEKLAAVARRSGDIAQAIDYLTRAVAIKPDSADLHNKLGDALFRAERFAEAETVFRCSIELDPHRKEPHFNLGTLLAHQGNFTAARAQLQTALEIDPHYTAAQNNLRIVEELLRQQAAEN